MYDQQLSVQRLQRSSGARRAIAVLGAAVMCGASVLIGGTTAAAAVTSSATCRISRLPVLEGTRRGWADQGGDRSGRYVLGTILVAGRGLVDVVWVDGKLTEPKLPGRSGRVELVNADGVMVVSFVGDDNRLHTAVKRGARLTELPPLAPGHGIRVHAINKRGDVVGSSSAPDEDEQPVVWPAARPGTVRALPEVPGQLRFSWDGWDIDDDGTVVGNVAFTEGYALVAYAWPPNGRPYPLGDPAGTSNAWVSAIRNGWAGGGVNAPLNSAVRWNLRTRKVEWLGPDTGAAKAINAAGTLVMLGGAIAHRGGPTVTLPDLVGNTRSEAKWIADNGMVAGWALDGQEPQAVVWRGC